MKFKQVIGNGGRVFSVWEVVLYSELDEMVKASSLFQSYRDAVKFLYLQVEEHGEQVTIKHRFVHTSGYINWEEE